MATPTTNALTSDPPESTNSDPPKGGPGLGGPPQNESTNSDPPQGGPGLGGLQKSDSPQGGQLEGSQHEGVPANNRQIRRTYVGRKDNVGILKTGYDALTIELNTENASSFRSSIATVLNRSLVGVAEIQAVEDGFEISTAMNLPQTHIINKFKFDYGKADHTRNVMFMQAIAQFVVLSFNQLVVDLQRSDTSIKVQSDAYTACQESITTAQDIVKNPVNQKQNATDRSSLPALLNDIIIVLQGIPDLNDSGTEISVNGLIIMLDVDKHSKQTINMANAVSYDDIMIYNANIAAALLAAKTRSVQGFKQLSQLTNVLKEYSKVRAAESGTISSIPEAQITSAPSEPKSTRKLTGGVYVTHNILRGQQA